jgi:predicted dehydrogenase
VHVLDIIQMGMGDKPPKSVSTLGGRYWITDNTESPDTLQVTYEFADGYLATYEYRESNAQPLFDQGYGSVFYGNQATLYVNRGFYKVMPEKTSDVEPVLVTKSNDANQAHWANFLDCVKTRKKPICDIEIGVRSSVMCLLANVSLRSGMKIDWDEKNFTTMQPEARKYLTREYRAPWKLEI